MLCRLNCSCRPLCLLLLCRGVLVSCTFPLTCIPRSVIVVVAVVVVSLIHVLRVHFSSSVFAVVVVVALFVFVALSALPSCSLCGLRAPASAGLPAFVALVLCRLNCSCHPPFLLYLSDEPPHWALRGMPPRGLREGASFAHVFAHLLLSLSHSFTYSECILVVAFL